MNNHCPLCTANLVRFPGLTYPCLKRDGLHVYVPHSAITAVVPDSPE